MKKDFGSKITKITVFVASIVATLALALKIKKDNDLLTSFENEEDDEDEDNDFGDVKDLDSLNPDTSTRQYVSINITKNDEE